MQRSCNRQDVRLYHNRYLAAFLLGTRWRCLLEENDCKNENDKMMEKQSKNKTKWLHLRLSADEYQQLQNLFKKSTCRKMSDFSRKNLLQKPVVLKYRNASLDDLIAELILTRKDLNAIGNNFNQAVKKLHTLNQIPEFKHWITVYELEKKVLFNAIDSIKKNIENLSQKWLQS